MTDNPHSRLIEALAEAKASAAALVLIGSYDPVGESKRRLDAMHETLERARAQSFKHVSDEMKGVDDQANARAADQLAKRLVEVDAIRSATGDKKWLADAHSAANQTYAYARGKVPLPQIDAARLVLSATRTVMSELGRPLDEGERRRKPRNSVQIFSEGDYPDSQVRRAIVMVALSGDAASAEYLESRAYDSMHGRDGRISSILDACRGDDEVLRSQARQVAADILAKDDGQYRVVLASTPQPSRDRAREPTSLADQARALARRAS